MQHILVLGAGYGGLLTALRLQSQIKKGKAQVTLVNASDSFTERIRLHQVASGQQLKQYKIEKLLKGTGVRFIQDVVRHINPSENTVTLDNQVIDYDILVVALGSRVSQSAIDGLYQHAYTLNTQSAHDLKLKLQGGGKLLVIGGGLTGIEAVTEFAERDDVEVVMVTRGQVGANLSDAGREHIRKTLNRFNVTCYENTSVSAVHETYADSNQGKLDFDACLWAGGFEASPLVAEAGFTVNAAGQMQIRDTLQSVDYDNVYGVGDVASIMMQSGNYLRMACAVAMPMGAHGADNIISRLNNDVQQPLQFAYALECISLGRHDALVQFVEADDTPKDKIVTGRKGAWIKELICRYTIWSLQLEKRFPGIYWYPKGIPAVEQRLSVEKA